MPLLTVLSMVDMRELESTYCGDLVVHYAKIKLSMYTDEFSLHDLLSVVLK